MIASAQEIKDEAERLGAIENNFGHYELPAGADGTTQTKFKELFSGPKLRRLGFRSFQDWIEREHIIRLLGK